MGKGPLNDITHKALFKSVERSSDQVKDSMLTLMEVTLRKNPELVDCRDKHDNTPLIHASKHGNFKAVEILHIRYNADLDKQNDLGKTALHISCLNKSEEITKFLIYSGAKQNIVDSKGNTAKDYAPQEFTDLFDQTKEA